MSSPVPLDLQAKISSWRLRAAEGTLSLEEMKEAIVLLRGGRVSAASASATGRKKKSATAPAAEDMLADLEGL